jgi:ABC-2 type transport system permease protein
MHELTAIFAIAQRDMLKFLRDIPRMISTFIAPILFIAALGGSMEAAFGRVTPFNLLEYTFTGVFAMTLFQTTAFGLISLIEDRENDFTQEIFVSPISRYSIVIGKIVGETLVAFPQALVILVLAGILGIGLTPQSVVALIGSGLIACLLGGAFGLIVLANLSSQRAAGQIFPFIMLPQYFLAGVFNPIQNLPPYLDVASRIAPLRYCVDLVRAAYYAGRPDYTSVVPDSPAVTLAVIAAMSAVFLGLGTIVFVRRERNR